MNRSILLSLYFYVLPLFNASLFPDVCDDEIRGRKFRHWLKNVTSFANQETSNSCCPLAAIFLCLINNITAQCLQNFSAGPCNSEMDPPPPPAPPLPPTHTFMKSDTRVGFYMYGRNTGRIMIAEECLSKPTDRR